MKRLRVELAGFGSLASGYGSRDLIVSITGRAPVWMPLARGWAVQEDTARDLVVAAERAGYDVVVVGPRSVPTPPPRHAPAAPTEEVPSLW